MMQITCQDFLKPESLTKKDLFFDGELHQQLHFFQNSLLDENAIQNIILEEMEKVAGYCEAERLSFRGQRKRVGFASC